MRITPNLEVSDVEDVIIDRDQQWVRRIDKKGYYWVLLPKKCCTESGRHCRDICCPVPNRGLKSEMAMSNYVQSLVADPDKWRVWVHLGTVNVVQC